MSKPPLRILIVEDNPDGRESLRLLLELQGHIVETASDGREGLEKALSWRPEAALVDIGLPYLDGLEVARRVRANLGDSVLLVAVTAYGQPDDRERSLAAGFDFHVVKPADTILLGGLLARRISRDSGGREPFAVGGGVVHLVSGHS